jgi:hypothetical protein
MKNQIIAVFPCVVESSKSFFVHIEPEIAQIIGGKIAELVQNPEVGIFILYARDNLS